MILGLTLASMLLAGILIGGITQQQARAEADMLAAAENESSVLNIPAERLRPGGPASAPDGERLRKLALTSVMTTIAEETDLTVSEIRAEVQNGQTLAEIAEAGGTTSASVQQHVIDEASMLLHHAITNGRMHEERADRILDGLTERLPDLMNNAELGDKLAQATEAFKQGVAERMTVRGVGAASDLSVRDVLARMRAGESIGEVAQSLGLSAAEVADAATPMLLQHLERPLQTGIISQEEADDFVAEFPERVAQVLEAPAQD
jgi:predicted transcriptional regulator